jgi:hypothetical protein
MIVQCCICKVIEAVKCPKCGIGPLIPDGAIGYWKCPSGHRFHEEDGGTSHGYCPSCFKKEMDKIKLQQSLKCYNVTFGTR